MILLSFCFIGLGYLAYLSFYPFPTLVIKSAIVTKDIKAGEVLMYTVDYCKYTKNPAIVYRTLHSVDESIVIPFPSIETITVAGCNITHVPLQTFYNLKKGNYYLLVDVDFSINKLQDTHVLFKTTNFKIK